MNLLRWSFNCLLLLACLLGLSLQPVTVRADTSPISLEAYWALVSETKQTLITLADRPESTQKDNLLALADQWEQAQQVRLDDGTLVNLDHTFWLKQFRADKPDRANLLQHLDALLAAHSTKGKIPSQLDTNSLRQILARPEFQWQLDQQPNFIADLLNRFFQWLTSLLGEPVSLSAPNPQTLQMLGIFAALFVGAILTYFLHGLFTDLTTDAALNDENGATDEPINAELAIERAEDLSSQGDYRSAVRYLYLSALLLLNERGLLYYDRTRTNREYLHDLNSQPQIAVLLRAMIDVFDKVWYGFQPLDAETYQLYARQVNLLKEQK